MMDFEEINEKLDKAFDQFIAARDAAQEGCDFILMLKGELLKLQVEELKNARD